MPDIAYIRANPDKVKLASEQKPIYADTDRLLALDAEIRKLSFLIDTLRSKRNALSEKVRKLLYILIG